jgi:ribose 5-phosphate isomerase A
MPERRSGFATFTGPPCAGTLGTVDDPRQRQKERAADEAVAQVQSGMVVGMGAGSTAALVATRLAERLSRGALRDLICVPCSGVVAQKLRALGLPASPLSERPQIDLTIDGADEVDPHLDLIKGAGGALLREKMVAQASRREIIVIDEHKLSPRLGTQTLLPVEVIPFGWRAEEHYLHGQGAAPMLRLQNGKPFISDEGNYILDCAVGPIADAAALARTLESRAGIVAHGLFLGLASEVIVGAENGVRHLRPWRV